MESVGKVRMKYHRKGETIHGIVRTTGFARNTVRKYLRNEHLQPQYNRTVIVKPKLGGFEAILDEWLGAEMKKPKKERATAQQLFERLQGKEYLGAYDSVQRYVKAFKQGLQVSGKAFIPLAFAPGEAYQFDWSQEQVEIGGMPQTVHVAHFRLCYSRKSFLAIYPRESQEMLFDAHIRAFEYFGGVSLRGIYDNMKTAIDLVFVGKDRQFNKRFLSLMYHYLIEPTACSPAAGWEKGQVEKQVQDMRRDIFIPKRKSTDLQAMNVEAMQKVEAIESGRSHPEFKDKTIAEVFAEERASLKVLPVAFAGHIERECRVSSVCLVQIDRNRYSVDCHYANCAVVVRLYADKVVVVAEGKVIGEHHRYFGKDHIAYNPWHYVPLLERKPGGLRNGAPFQEFGLPEGIEQMRHRLVKRRGGDKEFVKILQAIPIYGVEEVATACDLALEDGIIQGDYVLNVIGRLRPGVLEVQIPIYYSLQEEPWSDCGRYNGLLAGGNHA